MSRAEQVYEAILAARPEGLMTYPKDVKAAKALASFLSKPVGAATMAKELVKHIDDDDLLDSIDGLVGKRATDDVRNYVTSWLAQQITPKGQKTYNKPWPPEVISVIQKLLKKI